MALPFNDQDITSANAVVVLTIQELYPNGIQLQQFSTDAMAAADSVQVAETRMGVDGYMAAGVTPNIVQVTVNLEANSPSKRALDNLWAAMQSNKRLYRVTMTIKLVSTGETFQFYRGCLQTATPVPATQRILSPTSWVFHFERMEKV